MTVGRGPTLTRRQKLVQTLKQTSSREYPESAACVQDPVDSLNSAVRNAHRTSLRPSSAFEPRHPSLRDVNEYVCIHTHEENTRDATLVFDDSG